MFLEAGRIYISNTACTRPPADLEGSTDSLCRNQLGGENGHTLQGRRTLDQGDKAPDVFIVLFND